MLYCNLQKNRLKSNIYCIKALHLSIEDVDQLSNNAERTLFQNYNLDCVLYQNGNAYLLALSEI